MDQKMAFELSKYMGVRVRIKFVGGREVVGVLRGHDGVNNMVLDQAEEYLREKKEPYNLLEETRYLGLTVIRGTSVAVVAGAEAYDVVENPFGIDA